MNLSLSAERRAEHDRRKTHYAGMARILRLERALQALLDEVPAHYGSGVFEDAAGNELPCVAEARTVLTEE